MLRRSFYPTMRFVRSLCCQRFRFKKSNHQMFRSRIIPTVRVPPGTWPIGILHYRSAEKEFASKAVLPFGSLIVMVVASCELLLFVAH